MAAQECLQLQATPQSLLLLQQAAHMEHVMACTGRQQAGGAAVLTAWTAAGAAAVLGGAFAWQAPAACAAGSEGNGHTK